MKYNNNNNNRNEKECNKKKEGGGRKNPVMHNAIAHHPLTDARAAIHASQPTPPSLYTGNLGIEPATFLRY